MAKFINCSLEELRDTLETKELYCFGSGVQADEFFSRNKEMTTYVKGFIDNNHEKQGTVKVINGYSIPIISFEQFVKRYTSSTVVVITSSYFEEMLSQMDKEDTLAQLECYISFFLENNYKIQDFDIIQTGKQVIPKKIHYCWFGNNPIPKEFQEYMESWGKYCPDYEIIRWDESNYDVEKNTYMRQAYEAKKWGFVPDYARLDIIYNHGGIYLDTDVELIRSLDGLLHNSMFCGFESGPVVNLGSAFGAVKGHEGIKKLMEPYEKAVFINEDGSLNLTPSPAYQTASMKELGFKIDGTYQIINDIALYPSEVFSPINYFKISNAFSKNTFSIHHYAATWFDQKMKETREKMEASILNVLKRNQ